MKSLNLKNLNLQTEDILSKAQMKNILGGPNDGGHCSTGGCTVYDQSTGRIYSGTCGYEGMGGGLQLCECVTDLGFYNPNGGESHCWIPN